MNERLREVMKKGAVLLAAGCAYFVLYMTWGYNAVLLCMLPVLLALLIGSNVRYVRTGSRKMTRFENILIWALVIILLAWGVLRNL